MIGKIATSQNFTTLLPTDSPLTPDSDSTTPSLPTISQELVALCISMQLLNCISLLLNCNFVRESTEFP